jgi:hypothetical protein
MHVRAPFTALIPRVLTLDKYRFAAFFLKHWLETGLVRRLRWDLRLLDGVACFGYTRVIRLYYFEYP